MLKLIIESEERFWKMLRKGIKNLVSIMSLFHRSNRNKKSTFAYWAANDNDTLIELTEHLTEADIALLKTKRIDPQKLANLKAKKEIEEILAESHAAHTRHETEHGSIYLHAYLHHQAHQNQHHSHVDKLKHEDSAKPHHIGI